MFSKNVKWLQISTIRDLKYYGQTVIYFYEESKHIPNTCFIENNEVCVYLQYNQKYPFFENIFIS